jgi:hypothetical protein
MKFATESVTLNVEGFLWSGPKAKHQYPLGGNVLPSSLIEAKRIAGDFSELTKASVVRVTRKVEEKTTRAVLT